MIVTVTVTARVTATATATMAMTTMMMMISELGVNVHFPCDFDTLFVISVQHVIIKKMTIFEWETCHRDYANRFNERICCRSIQTKNGTDENKTCEVG